MLYLFVVGKLLGRGGDGFGLTASIFMFPILSFTTGLFCWLPLWLLYAYRVGPMSTSRALLLGSIVGLLMGFAIAGPRGFVLRGGAPLVNYFVILLATAGAVVHNWAASRDTARP